ncbi:MAG: hypothetical protein M1837_004906 [Sclerophora amabilis]|nr:MAG: hypothetical protein M1837_004906 [Sclerophora amabilis]
MATKIHLQIASQAFIQSLKAVLGDNAATVGLAVVGGSAVVQMTRHRDTRDVDFYITGANRMHIRDAIVNTNPKGQLPVWTVNGEAVCGLTYTVRRQGHDPVNIRVDIIDQEVTGWEMTSCKVLAHLASDDLPWGSRNDLICTKLKSAYDRQSRGLLEARQDVLDIEQLLIRKPGVLEQPQQKEHVEKYLPHVLDLSSWTKAVWNARLDINI